MKVLWASSWGVFAALTDAVYSPHHHFFGKNGQSNCGMWDDENLSLFFILPVIGFHRGN